MISTGEDNFFFFHRTPVLELWMLTCKALNYFILQLIKGVIIIVFLITHSIYVSNNDCNMQAVHYWLFFLVLFNFTSPVIRVMLFYFFRDDKLTVLVVMNSMA